MDNEKELENNQDKKYNDFEPFKCERCGSRNIYVLADGTCVCRKCNYRK